MPLQLKHFTVNLAHFPRNYVKRKKKYVFTISYVQTTKKGYINL